MQRPQIKVGHYKTRIIVLAMKSNKSITDSKLTNASIFLGLLLCLTSILAIEGTVYSRVGCFESVALGEELHSDCELDWNNFADSVKSILAECSKKASLAGISYIALHGTCKCSSVHDFQPTTATSSNKCIGDNRFCSTEDSVCTGFQTSVLVFQAVKGKCSKKLDVGIAIDASFSVAPAHWEYSKSLIKGMINSMVIGADNVKMSIMTFSTIPKVVNYFNEIDNADELKNKVDALVLKGGFTRTDILLEHAKRDIFTPSSGMREDSERVFVLITDGETNGIDATVNWHESVIVPAAELRSHDVKIFTASLGSNVPQSEINAVVSSPVFEHSLNVSDFSYPAVTATRFAEIICGEKFVNVALKQNTTQSSTPSSTYGSSSYAVDGNTDNNIFGKSCAWTNYESNPWWRVDLGKERLVFEVKIYNKAGCCVFRTTGLQIRIGSNLQDNGNQNPVCRENLSMYAGEKATFVCMKQLRGRYVNIRLLGTEKVLALCEVKVVAKVTEDGAR
ncbi:uncharacterized protein LOC135685394 isoform X1 [Rhopilema esculentum]|uniref:uncharacterized protein LOC135685394 isoform X1 n=1 Tax=Rhopilema esculentum TaxID=499914 RepID=UPI0031CE955B